jgi:hypothetical protein
MPVRLTAQEQPSDDAAAGDAVSMKTRWSRVRDCGGGGVRLPSRWALEDCHIVAHAKSVVRRDGPVQHKIKRSRRRDGGFGKLRSTKKTESRRG